MDKVVKGLTPDEIARVEARLKQEAVAAAKAPPRFVEREGVLREISLDLEFPVEYDGVTYEKVTIRRPLMHEWRAYLRDCAEAVKLSGPGADDYVDQVWLSIPAIVLEHLDYIDAGSVEAVQEGFFGKSSLPPDTTVDQASQSSSTTGEPSPSK